MRELTGRTTISLSPAILKEGKVRAKNLRYKNFSQYVAYLVDLDLRERPQHVTIREEPPEFGGAKKSV